jgi:PHD/YefM family antitoxin component YafN of YafNO toxin-antitoxin module
MWKNLDKVIKLIQKTGDKCVILNGDEEPIVVMNLDDYERLNFQKNEVSNLTQVELLDKINREIAIWRTANDDKDNSNLTPADLGSNNSDLFAENPDKALEDTPVNITNEDIGREVEKDQIIKTDENDEYLVEPVD